MHGGHLNPGQNEPERKQVFFGAFSAEPRFYRVSCGCVQGKNHLAHASSPPPTADSFGMRGRTADVVTRVKFKK